MSTPRDLTQSLTHAVGSLRGLLRAACVHRSTEPSPSTNQYCLFLQPQALAEDADVRGVFQMTLDRIVASELTVDEIHVLPGPFLRQQQTMDRQHAALRRLDEHAAGHFTSRMRDEFRAIFGLPYERATVLGGSELLRRCPELTPFGLELLWQHTEQHRLASSVTCAPVEIAGQRIFLVNGGTPALLASYTQPQSALAVFAISGPLHWKEARLAFVGADDPRKAFPGSLRRELFERRESLGLRGLRPGASGVHLSAGPVDALIELRRFRSAVTPLCRPALHEYQFGRKLCGLFAEDDVYTILANPTVIWNSLEQNLASLTEDVDEDAALELLLAVRGQLRFPPAPPLFPMHGVAAHASAAIAVRELAP